MDTLETLVERARVCRLCEPNLPLGARPVFQVHRKSRILIAGQAPGIRVHESGVPFDDASGKRLREWLGVDEATFYNPERFAILPMGFCYPGTGKSGDLPPRPECAPAWRDAFLSRLEDLRLTLVLGTYAQTYHLGSSSATLTDLVRSWLDEPSDIVPLPHPSPRNNRWLKKNPWFEAQSLPRLQERVRAALS